MDLSQSVTTGSVVSVGCKVPRDYFITQGSGESDLIYHSGSYRLALRKAHIEHCNILIYSSYALPGTCKELAPGYISDIPHGCVLDCMISEVSGPKGTRLYAGISYKWLKYHGTEEIFGGLVVKDSIVAPSWASQRACTRELQLRLHASLLELYDTGYTQYHLVEGTEFIEYSVPDKAYGTSLVAMCFVTHDLPIIGVI